jgi:hypothetical protein
MTMPDVRWEALIKDSVVSTLSKRKGVQPQEVEVVIAEAIRSKRPEAALSATALLDVLLGLLNERTLVLNEDFTISVAAAAKSAAGRTLKRAKPAKRLAAR